MQQVISNLAVITDDDTIVARRIISRESRPTRVDMLRLYRGGFAKPRADTELMGYCDHCESDDGGGVG